MNRRTAIRKALGAGAAVAALPVLDKVLEASDRVYTGSCNNGAPMCAPTEMAPPPPDTRTPEQVIADQDQEILNDQIRHLTREPDPWSRRYVYQVPNHEFDRLITEMTAQRHPITVQHISGTDCIIGPNGNLIRRFAQ